jgi:hypothetical protein
MVSPLKLTAPRIARAAAAVAAAISVAPNADTPDIADATNFQ